MKIGFYEIDEKEIDTYKKHFAAHELNFTTEPLTDKNIDSATGLEALSTRSFSKLQKEVLEKIPALKLISTRTTGYDHIDLAYCKEKNITVCNVPDYGAFTVAEHTIALMLAISRNLIPSIERTRKGDFTLDGLRGFELHGKTLGVIGVGSIGGAVIKIAKSFGMQILAFTRHPDQKTADELGFKFASLDEIIPRSDIITLHVPFTNDTHHIINKENIKNFKKGSVLINTARGGLIDAEAIVYALDEKILRGVGLDVLEEECFMQNEGESLGECNARVQLLNRILLQRENVIITPHNAFNSTESRGRILDITLNNITAFIENKAQNTL